MMNWKKLYMLVVCVLITYKKHVKLLEGVNHDQAKFFKNAKFGLVGYGGMKKWS